MGAVDADHICTCGDCEVEAFNDHCKFAIELGQIEGCIVDPSERRPGRTYERVQEMLAEIKSLQDQVTDLEVHGPHDES